MTNKEPFDPWDESGNVGKEPSKPAGYQYINPHKDLWIYDEFEAVHGRRQEHHPTGQPGANSAVFSTNGPKERKKEKPHE